MGTVEILSDSSYNSLTSYVTGGWERVFNGLPYIQFTIMDFETLWKYHLDPCDTIRKYVPILQIYHFTLKDLNLLNWTVTYPPNENMKNVRMFPPYE